MGRLVTRFQLGEGRRFLKVQAHVNGNDDNDETDQEWDTPKPGLSDVLNPQEQYKVHQRGKNSTQLDAEGGQRSKVGFFDYRPENHHSRLRQPGHA
jgi:hypothetical protein